MRYQPKSIHYKEHKAKKYKVATVKPKKVFCPLCIMQHEIKMTHNEADGSYSCPHCGHKVLPKLNQINLISSQLRASNDPANRQKAFVSRTFNTKRRVMPPQSNTYFQKTTRVYQNLMEADNVTNYHDNGDTVR